MLAASSPARGSFTRRPSLESQEVVEVWFGAQPPPDAEHVRGHHVRVERHEAARSGPEESRIAQQVVDLERLARIEPQLLQRDVHPAALGMVRIEGHDYQHLVAEIR